MGSGFRTFTAGEILTASNVQNYLQDQVVMTFAGSAARSSAIGTANFEEGMLTYLTDVNKLQVYTGAEFEDVFDPNAWTTYTPTFTNVTVGNATVVFKYKKLGKTVFVRGTFIFGSTSSISGIIRFTLPVNAVDAGFHHASVLIEDTGVEAYQGTLFVSPISDANLKVINSAGTNAVFRNTSSTVPMTWNATDLFKTYFFYEAL